MSDFETMIDLMSLPDLPFEKVLNYFDQCDLLNFILFSVVFRNHAVNFPVATKKIRFTAFGMDPMICWVQNKGATPIYLRFIKHYNYNSRSLPIGWQHIPPRVVSQFRLAGVNLKLWFEAPSSFYFECPNLWTTAVEVLTIMLNQFKVQKLALESNICPFRQVMSFAKYLTVRPTESFSCAVFGILTQKSFEEFLELAVPKRKMKLSIRTTNFRWQTSRRFKLDTLNIQHARWFGRDALLNSDCQNMEFYHPGFTFEDVNQFIKNWLAGSNAKFQQLNIRLGAKHRRSGPIQDVYKDLNLISTEQIRARHNWPPIRFCFYDFIGKFFFVSDGPVYHIQRRDGKMASLQEEDGKLFRFTIWRAEFIPCMECRAVYQVPMPVHFSPLVRQPEDQHAE